MCGCLLHASQLGTWPTTQARALTGNQTSNLSVCRPALSPLSHTSQGKYTIFEREGSTLMFLVEPCPVCYKINKSFSTHPPSFCVFFHALPPQILMSIYAPDMGWELAV